MNSSNPLSEGEIAGKLTDAQRAALCHAELQDGQMRVICRNFYARTLNTLEAKGLIDWRSHLTPLGLAVRARLQNKAPIHEG